VLDGVSAPALSGDPVPGGEQAGSHVPAHVPEADEADGGCSHSGIISGLGP
jgi:hypothetical protein